MSVLLNFPMRDQLTEPTADGRPNENARMNCVMTSAANDANWLTRGRVALLGDQIKDAVYGEAWAGRGTSASAIVAYLASFGIRLAARSAPTQRGLITLMRQELAAAHPTLFTMPSAWNTPPADPMHPGSSHVATVFQIDDTDNGYMTAMNPWHGFADRRPIATWVKLLCYGQVWPMSLIPSGGSMITLPAGVTVDASGVLHYQDCPFVSISGFAADIRSGKLSLRPGERPLENEHDDGAGGTEQWYSYSHKRWTPASGTYDAPVGAEFAALTGERDTVKQSLAQLTAQRDALLAQIANSAGDHATLVQLANLLRGLPAA